MKTPPARTGRPAAVLLALAGLTAPALAQSVDRDPSQLAGMIRPVPADPSVVMKALQGRPTGTMKIHGLTGVLDYERGHQPSVGPVEALVTLPPGARALPQDQLNPGEEAAYPVELNWAFLDALEAEGPHRAAITLPGGDRLELVFVKKQETIGPRRFAWIGQIAGIPASEFVLARYNQVINLGVRELETGGSFNVMFSPVAGGHTLRVISRQRTPGICGTCADGVACQAPQHEHANPAGHDALAGVPAGPSAPSGPAGTPDSPAPADPGDQVDVLFVASNQAITAYTADGVNAFILRMMAKYNGVILPNSGLAGRARITGIVSVPAPGYNEAATLNADLNAITQGLGAFSFLPVARADLRADHVVLIRDRGQPTTTPSGAPATIIGLAWRPGTFAELTNPGNGNAIVAIGDFDPDFTFAHELTHNMGGAHDPANSGASSLPAPHGFNFTCANVLLACTQGWGTVMAYEPNIDPFLRCGPYLQLGMFSRANVSVTLPFPYVDCASVVIGVEGIHNVAGLIPQTRPLAAQWRIAVTRQWVKAGAPSAGAQGTNYSPWPGLIPANTAVQGPLGTAEIFVAPGTYAEASPGNPTVLSKPATITNTNSSVGPVILR